MLFCLFKKELDGVKTFFHNYFYSCESNNEDFPNLLFDLWTTFLCKTGLNLVMFPVFSINGDP